MDLIKRSEDSGVAQAWLMATVGTKQAYRRTLKKGISEISIPQTCDEVSNIANEVQNLRLASNLLLGLSLIYKQKVFFMATDLSIVFDRICSPLFTKDFSQSGAAKKIQDYRKRERLSVLQDDHRFVLDVDFIPESLEIDTSGDKLDEAFQRSLAIREQDVGLRGTMDTSQIPSRIAAEAQEKLFMDFVNRSINTKEVLLEESLVVDFEFDQNGEIVGGDAANIVDPQEEILFDLNLEEDFNTVSATFEDISKSLQQTSGDIGQGVLMQSKATITEVVPISKRIKRRKLMPVVDDVTTYNKVLLLTEMQGLRLARPHPSVSDLFHSLSLTQPPFLNMCYRIIFGPSATVGISPKTLPLSARHADISKLDSFLRGMEDIERGRDIQNRRPSLSLADDLFNDRPVGTPAEEIEFGPEMFNLEPLSPMLEDIEGDEETSREDSGEFTLHSFKEFLHDRAESVLKTGKRPVAGLGFSFESLIPSRNSVSEEGVQKKLAANALSCLLQLATSGSIYLDTTCLELLRPAKSEEIYIAFI